MRFFNPKTAFFALAAAVLMVQCAVATTLSPTLELLGPLVREGDGPVIAYNEFLARISSEHHGLAKKFWTKYAIPRYNRGLSTSGSHWNEYFERHG
ncbi:uncharacterized protein PAN0_010c4129 [Moesziomyces antarcticus]|uniref:Uncharacterized protein n=2 Tax=Pseudozyma antarctica TaxID=84753 RepID=A0A5C3FPY2_PSEA2|nr:uncharacterized protein PAN0_010c4129 [Moesziomyces antarcticus]GAK65907.1 hypothetical protein PAN0_010c4129 [Moesziomyces antarcticus]SPO45541.1 uncharacterized protein PSANT_03227 [Moesziomyces antarcticus]